MSLSRPVDLVHLSRYTGGDKSVNAEVLRLFATQSAELLTKLDEAVSASDAKTWREITHSLKGGARGIGAFRLAEAAQDAEAANPASDKMQAAHALHVLKSRALAVTLFIDTYLSH